MKNYYSTLVVILCLFGFYSNSQQINVNNSYTAQQLVENNLVVGCVEISDIASEVNGTDYGFNSFAYFESGNSNFPFDNGIMLSTGNPMSGGNGQNNDILNEGDENWLTDPDLEEALGISGTLNATSIEFNFISITNRLEFNYILASEEYFGNFPCEYSDGFAFLIKEAGTNSPFENIALIPGTNIPVNTNTVHPDIIGFCDGVNEEFFEGFNVGDTNYNGRTTVMTATANITPYTEYTIKLVIADQTDQNYDSAVFIEGNSFNAEVNLGEDIQTCAAEVDLEGSIANDQAEYSWYFNNNLIDGADSSALTVTETGIYRIQIDIPLAGSTCTIEDEIEVTLSSTQSADAISDYELCDNDSNGVETFDLSTKTTEALATVPDSDYLISYHYSQNEAENNSNAITSPIQNTSNPQPIVVRIEDQNNGCLAYSSFNLIVHDLPAINTPSLLVACADVADNGNATIDLSIKDDEITGGNPELNVTYYLSAEDAQNGQNAILLPYINDNNNNQVFVRVTNIATGCSSITTLDIDIQDKPVINTERHLIDACDADLDGFADFDLTQIIDDVLEGLTGVTITFHETEEDAENGTNPIEDETAYPNPEINQSVVYIRVTDDTTGCASYTAIEIHTNLLLTGTDIREFTQCDPENDGNEPFDLEQITIDIINNIEDVSIDFYLSEEDRDNNIGAIDTSVPFFPSSNPQTLYITLTSPTCSEVAEIGLFVDPVGEAPIIGLQVVCDEDQDGFTQMNLNQFNELITGNSTDLSVTYYLSLENAENNENAVDLNYVNESNPQEFWFGLTTNETGCTSIGSFEVEVLPAPISETPSEIIICDSDSDGVSQIDLDAKIPEIVSDTSNLDITFHTSLEDAENNDNAIPNTSSFSASTQVITVRIESTVTGCYSLEPLNVVVNSLPIINPIEVFKFCQDGDDGIGEFIFQLKDAEILGDQTGKQVFYFENADDAQNNNNPIDKDEIYTNSSNPQIIHVRVENITDPSCYSVSSFPIEVGTNPDFNEATDIFVCDDISNDGSVTFDLNIQLAEITDGIPDIEEVTFHTSELDALNNENAIDFIFENTTNPQQIFTRVNNGSICESYTSFVLNVVAAPGVNAPAPIEQCDDDYDGITVFDLTVSEIDILDVRQDNIELGYYESEQDAQLNQNEITDPTNYTNLSNPQTVYIRIENSLSNCNVTLPLELIVNLPPSINLIDNYQICENDDNSLEIGEIDDAIFQSQENITLRYFTSEEDALNITNEITGVYNYTTVSDQLFVRADSTVTGCFIIHGFELSVNPPPVANEADNIESCDDDFDGFIEVTLSLKNSEILGNQNPNDFTVTYYTDFVFAEEDVSRINPESHDAMDGDVIYARVENNRTGCYAISQFTIFVYARPVLEIGDQVICLENLPLVVSADTNIPGDFYSWSTNESTSEIEIIEPGTYSVTVTTPFGCETTEVFEVIESEAANIEFTEVIDFSDPNNVTVTVTGIGNYLYQLDDQEPQESNVFENVALGYHILTIIDLNGCARVSKEIVVIDAPKFMTPNGDGFFDTWHISGVETLPGTTISIFDRYGKLLKQLSSSTEGWDGTFNGQELPATDYWYIATVRKDNIEFEVKGHFAIRH
ncbi:MAG: choice-of-anchor L domain-containing protein [Bacteroidota bacterium]